MPCHRPIGLWLFTASRVHLRLRVAPCFPGTRLGGLHLAAGALIVWAVFQSIRRFDLRSRFFVAERLARSLSRRNLLFSAVAERDLFPRHKKHLADRHAV